MIRNNHSMEKPTTTAPTRTTTVFDQTRGVQSDRGPAFNLPMSPLLGGLIDNANSAMARLTREQSNGFLPFPMKRHWRFYPTDATSLSAPYVAPPSLASLTREKPGDSKRRLFPLSQSVLAGLESAMASVAETASWLDWWLSTVSGFSEALQSLSAAQLRETSRFRFESNRFRREPDSLSADQSAPLPPRRDLSGVQVHGAGGRTRTPPPFPDAPLRGDLPFNSPGHRAQQGPCSIQRRPSPQGTAPTPHPKTTCPRQWTVEPNLQVRRLFRKVSTDSSSSAVTAP